MYWNWVNSLDLVNSQCIHQKTSWSTPLIYTIVISAIKVLKFRLFSLPCCWLTSRTVQVLNLNQSVLWQVHQDLCELWIFRKFAMLSSLKWENLQPGNEWALQVLFIFNLKKLVWLPDTDLTNFCCSWQWKSWMTTEFRSSSLSAQRKQRYVLIFSVCINRNGGTSYISVFLSGSCF